MSQILMNFGVFLLLNKRGEAQMISIIDLAMDAIAKNELDKFLRGDKPYGIKLNQWVAANVPTDWTVIIPQGIYEIYKQKPAICIEKIFEDTIIKMIFTDLTNLYVALNIVYNQLLWEHDHRAAFKINRKKIMPLLTKKLHEKQMELENDFRWLGNGEPKGLWSEVIRIDGILKDEIGQGVL